MLLIGQVEVKPSTVHGMGLFAGRPIPAGTWLWAMWEYDRKIPVWAATDEQLHYGYVSNRDGRLVICGDHSKWWNFGTPANCIESPELVNGEPVIVASRDIPAGEELLISLESDADATRKLLYNRAQWQHSDRASTRR